MWLQQNMGTIVTALILCLIVFLVIKKMWKDKKNGKSCCGCSSCSGCGCSGKAAHTESHIGGKGTEF